jgi:methionyl-tRNA formyltransferase
MLRISIVSNSASWLNPWIAELADIWRAQGHEVCKEHRARDVREGDLCFLLSCHEIVQSDVLSRSTHNIVVHGSDLPKGKGWSPLTWQILESKSQITMTLLEASQMVDSGVIYLQEQLVFEGHELVLELREAQARSTIRLCSKFVEHYPHIVTEGRSQVGESSFYPRRGLEDSRLDPEKSLAEQFEIFRVVDNENYPAFFDYRGTRYVIRIEKDPNDAHGKGHAE